MRKYLIKILVTVFILCSVLISFHLLIPQIRYEFADVKREKATFQEDDKNLLSIYDKILSSAEDEDLLLVQMSLSLIKNYYVDTKQFDFSKMLEVTLESMKHHGDLNYTIREDYIEINHESVTKKIPKQWVKDELGKIACIFEIAQFLTETHKLKKPRNSIVETLSVMISSLDPYSRLLSEEDYKELKEGTEGEFGGLGIIVGSRDSLVTVMKLLPNSPAARAGVHPFDNILSVNGQATFGLSLEELVKVMRGLPGSSTTLTFLRENAKAPFDISMNRELVQIDPVTIRRMKTPLNNEALMLKLDTFSVKSYERLRNEIQKNIAMRNSKIDGIIIDLRSNPGGLLDQAVKISKILLSEGSIVTVKGSEVETEYADHENLDVDCPIVVLIDEDSASASEILAGALKDHDRAMIIGQPSYGKGTVQTIFDLPSGRALKLTIARYLTPSGSSIQGVGVMPDIWLHPILKRNINKNLMGHYRYRVDGPFIGFTPKSKMEMASGSIDGYYLKDPEEDSPSDKSKEVELALNIFDEYKQNESNKRSNHEIHGSSVISKVQKNIKQKIKNWNAEVSNFLNARNIRWFEKNNKNLVRSLQVTDLKISTPEKIFPGNRVSVSVEVRNLSQESIERTSVFLRSLHREMDSPEILLGTLEPMQKVPAKIDFQIPRSWLSGKVLFQIGIAINGIAVEKTEKEFTLEINHRNEAILSVSSNLEKELKAGETTSIKVRVSNESDFDVHFDSIRVINLSGKQLMVEETPNVSHEIGAHEEMDIPIKVTAIKERLSNNLSLGLSLESSELRSPLYKIIYLNKASTAARE